jgi:hypothetical protein
VLLWDDDSSSGSSGSFIIEANQLFEEIVKGFELDINECHSTLNRLVAMLKSIIKGYR